MFFKLSWNTFLNSEGSAEGGHQQVDHLVHDLLPQHLLHQMPCSGAQLREGSGCTNALLPRQPQVGCPLWICCQGQVQDLTDLKREWYIYMRRGSYVSLISNQAFHEFQFMICDLKKALQLICKPRFPCLHSHHQSCCAFQQGACRQRPAASAD